VVAQLRRHRIALRVVVGAAAAAALVIGLRSHRASALRAAPALPTRALSGQAVTIAQLRGHSAALVFWATWCPGCHAEAPAVERFARSAAGRGRVVGIDYSDPGNWRRFLRTYSWTFPVLADPNGATLDAFGTDTDLPVTVILDASGRVAAVHYGAETTRTLRAALATAG
jgi:peroxiredoxin